MKSFKHRKQMHTDRTRSEPQAVRLVDAWARAIMSAWEEATQAPLSGQDGRTQCRGASARSRTKWPSWATGPP